MYQFPDSGSQVMEPQEPKPLKKGASYRIIIIANLLLALLVVVVVWFVFFFKSESNNTPAVDLSSETKPIGAFTPIVIDDNSAELPSLIEKNDAVSSITEIATKPISNGEIIDIQTNNTEPNSKESNNRELLSNSDYSNNPNNIIPSKIKEQKHIASPAPLSAIDLIANELMKNQLTKTNKKQENDIPPKPIITPVTIAPATTSLQLTNTTESNNNLITAQEEKQHPLKQHATKKNSLKKNQVNLDQTTALPLDALLQKTQHILNDSDKKLIAEINAVDASPQKDDTVPNINGTNDSKKHKSKKIDTYNSIPLNTGNDIDKIMAAMGDTKKPEDIATIEKLDKMVAKLLKNEESKAAEMSQYIQKLQPETEENRKAIRTITVREGEKLWDIAVRAYGDGNKYKKILQANPLLKTNPKLIKAGVILRAPL